ncbi:hypothetical protein [Lentzea aerocolonigenes]|uniref:hypothetical protein n=1 Tax=Lentzea aerocolonigenes TaxID=68170 RepID=UPI000AFC7538|nr:hypothetical protein [Lentzea aerocolonigenes]MCP2246389.1 hypothetical protein [Lentzea aerocolonigenes]
MRALLLAVLIVCTCPPFAHAEEGALVTVFWDRNTNGVRDEDEPGYRDAEVALRDESGRETVARTGTDGTYRLPRAGRWTVSHEETKFVTTTPTTVESDGGAVEFGVRGAEVCGTVWLDSDFDLQIGEPETRIAGHRISVVDDPDHSTTSAADGTYCLHDLPAGPNRLQSEDRARVDGTAWIFTKLTDESFESGSKFDMLTGKTLIFDIKVPGSVVTGYDSGFHEPRGMGASAGLITVDKIDYDGVRVGDKLIVRCGYTVGGNAPDIRAATLTFPDGLKVVRAFGDHGLDDVAQEVVVDGQKVTVRTKERMFTTEQSVMTAHVEVQHAFAAQNITCEVLASLYVPADGSSATSVFEIGAADSEPAASGTAPVWKVVGAVALAGVAALVVVLWRRRRRA